MVKYSEIEPLRRDFLKTQIVPQSFEDSFFPIHITWFVDLKCNLVCPYCFVPEENSCLLRFSRLNSGEVDVLTVLHQLRELGVLRIEVLGGEPFLARATVLALANCALDFGIAYKSTSTNGLIYDEDIVSALLKLGGTHFLQVSVDAATPETYRKVRGADKLARVIENTKRFVDAGLNVGMSMVLTKHNIHEIVPFAELAKSVGVNTISFGGFMPLGRGRQVADWILDYEDIIYAHETINNIKGIRVIMSKEMFDGTCSAGISEAAMMPNGDIYPCGMFLSIPEARLGNIFDDQLNKFNNPWYAMMVNYRISAECVACDLPPICGGACKAMIYSHLGEFKPAEPLCYLWGREK